MEKLLSVGNTATEDTPNGRILIVDDDPVVAGMLGISLEAAGHTIVEAYSGEEALALLAQHHCLMLFFSTLKWGWELMATRPAAACGRPLQRVTCR
jgi:CheY-like chemotaxis protein